MIQQPQNLKPRQTLKLSRFVASSGFGALVMAESSKNEQKKSRVKTVCMAIPDVH